MAAGNFEAAEVLHGYGQFPQERRKILDISRSLLYESEAEVKGVIGPKIL